MTATRTKPLRRAPAAVLSQKRFTLDEYHRMIDAGILPEGSPYELLNGIVREKMPNNPPHASGVYRVARSLDRLLGDQFVVRSQLPITIPESDSEPEPDIAVSVGPDNAYDSRHPGPGDILLLIEIAHSSLPMDRGEKLAAYAAAKVPVYWVVNIPGKRIEVYSQPRAGKNPTYRKREDFARGSAVPVVLGGKAVAEVAVSEILG